MNMILVEDITTQSNLQFNTSVDYKLATGKDESFPPKVMKNEKNGNIRDIMDELAVERPQLKSPCLADWCSNQLV